MFPTEIFYCIHKISSIIRGESNLQKDPTSVNYLEVHQQDLQQSAVIIHLCLRHDNEVSSIDQCNAL